MLEAILVKDIMNKEVVSVRADTPVAEVVKVLFAHGFNGVPVVDDGNLLVGLITDYDFIAKGSPIYFSPLGRVLKELEPYRRADEKTLEIEIKELLASGARRIMNAEPITLSPTSTLIDAADLFLKHHRVNPIPVIEDDRKLVGIVSRYDLIKLYADPEFWASHFRADGDGGASEEKENPLQS